MTDTDIKNEVVKIVERSTGRMPATSIVHSIIKSHGIVKGDNAEFYELCAYGHVRSVVREAFRRMKCDDFAESTENLLPGFERLQRRYIIDNGDESHAVPIEQMTPAEFRMKIDELRRHADGCVKHAHELERYLKLRKAA